VRSRENERMLTVSGRAPAKVSTESDSIHIGDYIMSSSLAGVGMKSTTAGKVVGVALESFDGTNATTCGTSKCGKMLVFVNVGEGNVANAMKELKSENAQLKNYNAAIMKRLDALERGK